MEADERSVKIVVETVLHDDWSYKGGGKESLCEKRIGRKSSFNTLIETYKKQSIVLSQSIILSSKNVKEIGINLLKHKRKRNVWSVVVQPLSHTWLFATPWTTARHASLSFTIFQSLLKFMSIKSVMPFNHLILCRPLLLPSIFPSIRVFFNESALCIRRPKYWSFNFSVNPANEYSGLTYFRIDWFDLLAVQGTLKPQMPSMCY